MLTLVIQEFALEGLTKEEEMLGMLNILVTFIFSTCIKIMKEKTYSFIIVRKYQTRMELVLSIEMEHTFLTISFVILRPIFESLFFCWILSIAIIQHLKTLEYLEFFLPIQRKHFSYLVITPIHRLILES